MDNIQKHLIKTLLNKESYIKQPTAEILLNMKRDR
jgi:hypothetical protein